MKYVIFAWLITTVLAADNAVKLVPPQPSPEPTSTPSTNDSTTVSTTTPVAPTKSTTIVTTTKIPTTSIAPTTTTIAPPPPPPPTPSPAPLPPVNPSDPPTGLWALHYGNTNNSCVILKAAIQVEYPYKYKSKNGTSKGLVNVPKNATVEGDCDVDNTTLTLKWFYTNDSTSATKNSLVVKFDETKDKYEVKQITININPVITFDDYNGNETIVLTYNHALFPTSSSKSYKCDKEQTLNLTQTSNATVGHLHIWHTQLQAFYKSSSQQFESAEDCEPISTSDVVPLAVGCALAGLVIIVLVAYLIGRKRAQARGYLSMFSQNKKEAEYIPMKTISCFN